MVIYSFGFGIGIGSFGIQVVFVLVKLEKKGNLDGTNNLEFSINYQDNKREKR